jgi:hypothetical protein
MHTLPYHFGDDDDEWSPSEAVMEAKCRSPSPSSIVFIVSSQVFSAMSCRVYLGLRSIYVLSMFIYVLLGHRRVLSMFYVLLSM